MKRRSFLASIAALFAVAKVKAGPTYPVLRKFTIDVDPAKLGADFAEYTRYIYVREGNLRLRKWLPNDAQKAFAERYGLPWPIDTEIAPNSPFES